jgi:hypothetical protein
VHEAARVGVDDEQRELDRAVGDAGEAQRRPLARAPAREALGDLAVRGERGARDRELARRRGRGVAAAHLVAATAARQRGRGERGTQDGRSGHA